MSKFYGQTRGYTKNGSSRTTASRTGSEGIRSSVQSYEYSIILDLRYSKNNEMLLTVEGNNTTAFYGECLYNDTAEKFIKLLQVTKKIGVDSAISTLKNMLK